jgi:hypothetical protein
MTEFDWTMPEIVKALHRLEFNYEKGEGMNFQQSIFRPTPRNPLSNELRITDQVMRT